MGGAAALLITELLSPFHLLRRGPMCAAWIALAVAGGLWLYANRKSLSVPPFRPLECAIAAVILAVSAAIGLTAALSPPDTFDAMAYHMPRVVYWAQSGSVAFFPTPFFNQISMQPLSEYLMLHTYVLSGGDRFINLVTFCSFLCAVAAVSALAGALGLKSRGQAFAALFCATLPNGILQASGAKNDWLLALWLLSLFYFTLRRNSPFAGLCFGLALATKATAYLFAPPMLAFAWAASGSGLLACPVVRRFLAPVGQNAILRAIGNRPVQAGCQSAAGKQPAPRKARAAAFAVCLAAGALLLNGPQYARNYSLSGSVLGYDSAHGDGLFRWRNERPGWKSTVSNALRNASEQVGARSAGWNQAVFDFVVRAHRALGIDPQDPATTWPWSRYEPPTNAKNHEADANNRWHLLLLAAALLCAAFARRWRWLGYGCALLAAFLLFCFYLKW